MSIIIYSPYNSLHLLDKYISEGISIYTCMQVCDVSVCMYFV